MRAITGAAIAVFAFVAGYLAGGWVYEVSGGHLWAGAADWLDRYQTLVGAGVALLAGWLAWRGLERQTRQALALASKQDQDAWEAMKAGLRPILEELNEVWHSVELAQLGHLNAETKQERMQAAAELYRRQRNVERLDALVTWRQFLSPTQRRRIAPVISALRSAHTNMKTDTYSDGRALSAEHTLALATMDFTIICERVAAIDTDLALIFARRQKEEIKHSSYADIMRRHNDA